MICSSFSRTAGLSRAPTIWARLHTRAAAWHATRMNACMTCWLSRGERLGEKVRSDKERAGAAPSKPPAGAGLKPGGGATSSQDVARRVKGHSDAAGRRKNMNRMSKAEREEWKVLRLKAQEGLALAAFTLPI